MIMVLFCPVSKLPPKLLSFSPACLSYRTWYYLLISIILTTSNLSHFLFLSNSLASCTKVTVWLPIPIFTWTVLFQWYGIKYLSLAGYMWPPMRDSFLCPPSQMFLVPFSPLCAGCYTCSLNVYWCYSMSMTFLLHLAGLICPIFSALWTILDSIQMSSSFAWPSLLCFCKPWYILLLSVFKRLSLTGLTFLKIC
jgi:hypothetical protein